ncbi:MAG TPA: TonB-dependent receptor, partial [Hyphomicrobiales bacterium]|nr:TonB-dependent receptor [Hyphomicrobiales bacterium]
RRESISLLSGWQGRVYADNAFLRPEVSQLMLDNGAEYVGYGFFPQNIVDSPLGESVQDTKNEMASFTGGFSHDFTNGFLEDWSVQGYYQYGKNVQDFITLNGVRTDRLQLAMDAVADPVTGQPICRVNLPQFTGPISEGGNGGLFADCVPLNTFGGIGNMSRGAADYVMDRDNKVARQFTHQDMAELVLSGPLSEGFGAGPIDAAFGVSYRKEEFRQYTLDESDEYPAQVDGTLLSDLGLLDPGLRGLVEQAAGGPAGVRFVPAGYRGDSNSSAVLFSSLRSMVGSYDVKEAFAEFNVPLLAGLPFMDSLESSLAARWADYEGSGDIWAWKVGLNWTINDELRVRATSSRDVRAASLRERFDQTRGGVNVRNPWDNGALVSAASLSGGNPNVTPEEADTLTAGIVYQPNWLDGFSASLDWYSIDINDAIAQLTAQQIVDNCRGGDLTLCQYVITPNGPITNPTGNDFRQIDRVDSLFINLANQRIEGLDVELRYRTDIDLLGGGAERLSWRFLASYLGENSTQNPGAVRDERVGQLGTGFALPENKVTTSLTYMNGPYTAFLQARWIDGGILDRTYMESNVAIPASQRPADSFLSLCNNGATICTIDDNSIPSIVYWDARFGANLGREENLEIFLNINNLLDKEPPIAPGTIGRTGVGTGVGGLYDILGRNYTLGFNYEFAGF